MPERIVEIARSYLETPFHHQGRVKGVGIDCLGLVVCVARERGFSVQDRTNYGKAPDGIELRRELGRQMVRVDNYDIGDVLLIRFRREPQHLAIVTNYPAGGFGLIHAYMRSDRLASRVVETGLDADWKSHIVGAYRFPEFA